MAKENTSGQKQTSGTSQSPSAADTTKNNYTHTFSTSSSQSRKSTHSGKKGNRPQIGGTAVTGAKSTQPKQTSNSNNPQQQELENSNRAMRRRMEQLGTSTQSPAQAKTPSERRKERKARIKERQQAQVSAVKRSLPGGKLATDVSRVYYMLAGIAGAIVLLILIFVVLRATGVLH